MSEIYDLVTVLPGHEQTLNYIIKEIAPNKNEFET